MREVRLHGTRRYEQPLGDVLVAEPFCHEADDIAASVVYLASNEARYISGVALAIDGAQTAG